MQYEIDFVGKNDGKVMEDSKEDERDESITEHNQNQSVLHMPKSAKSMCEQMVVDADTNKDARNENVGSIDAILDNVDGIDNVDLNIGDLQLEDSENRSMHDNKKGKTIDEDGDDEKKTASLCKRRVIMDDEDDDHCPSLVATKQQRKIILNEEEEEEEEADNIADSATYAM